MAAPASPPAAPPPAEPASSSPSVASPAIAPPAAPMTPPTAAPTGPPTAMPTAAPPSAPAPAPTASWPCSWFSGAVVDDVSYVRSRSSMGSSSSGFRPSFRSLSDIRSSPVSAKRRPPDGPRAVGVERGDGRIDPDAPAHPPATFPYQRHDGRTLLPHRRPQLGRPIAGHVAGWAAIGGRGRRRLVSE